MPEHPDLAIGVTPANSGHYVPNKPAQSTITITNKGSAASGKPKKDIPLGVNDPDD